jgi:YD repeat-containing protein
VSRTFDYDDVGNLTSILNRNEATRSFGYDALNRQTSENWSTGRSMGFVSTMKAVARSPLTQAGRVQPHLRQPRPGEEWSGKPAGAAAAG